MTLKIINPQVILDVCAGDKDILKELVGIFLEQMPQQINDLEKACQGSDPQAIKSIAHKIKGSASYFGAEYIVDHAKQIENIENPTPKELQPLLNAIAQDYQSVKSQIPGVFQINI